MKITNFGGNVVFEPKHWYAPRTEEEVLDILNTHARGKIRVIASGHCWSDAAQSDDVTIDMRYFDSVVLERSGISEVWARVGGGCILKRLLDTVHEQSGHTLPTLGGIKKQTIAGAISTATHGSGHPSLSHYMTEIRVAAYDPETGKACIFTYTDGEELRAARCALGCMGVILSVKFQLVPKYYVAQSIEERDSVEQILADKEKYQLQQFILSPYSWKWYVYTRRVVQQPARGFDRFYTYAIRALNFFGTDIVMHFVLKLLVSTRSARHGVSKTIQWFFRSLLPSALGRARVVTDVSEHAITLRHELYRHLEMELFIPERNMVDVARMVRHITALFAADEESIPPEVATSLRSINRYDELLSYRATYTHHYPLYFRQIQPDDTLISMTAGAEEWTFSLSFFTYLPPNKREHFFTYVKFVAQVLAELYDVRPHWGKYVPLTFADVEHLYPKMSEFHRICSTTDPNGVFRNDYTSRVLGFKE